MPDPHPILARLRKDAIPALIGAAIGLALAGYFLFYLPMSRNHDECGRVTLCDAGAQP